MSRSLFGRRAWLLGLWATSWSVVAVSPVAAATVLFFVNNAIAPQRADPSIVEELEDAGHQVVLFDTDDTTFLQQIDAVDNEDPDVILISETISSASMVFDDDFSLKDVDKPIISFEAYMWEDAGWTGRIQFVDFGNTGRPGDLVEHPELHECQPHLFLSESAACLGADLADEVEVYLEPYSLNFGFPSDDADVIATVDEEGEFPTILLYEAGDLLKDDSEAPAVRIGFFLGQNASGGDPNCDVGLDWANVTGDGKDLFLAAIEFAVNSNDGAGCPAQAGPTFKRGDSNVDGTTNITDVVFVLNFLFVGEGDLKCADAADTDDSGDLNLTDAVGLLNFLFTAGQEPAPPLEECGPDPTEDENIECSFPPCEG